MWSDHPFSQRNKAAKGAVAVKVGGEGRGQWTKFERGGEG